MAMNYSFLLLILVVVAPSAQGVVHTVGGTDGWSQSADLPTWASGETFTVGDTLVFSYSGTHSVDIVSKDDYENCGGSNVLKSFSGGQTSVPLSSPGQMYFICPTGGHCSSGMKLAITVVQGTTATSPPSTTTPSGNTSPSVLSPPGSSSDGSTDYPTTKSPTNEYSGTDGYSGRFNRIVFGFCLLWLGWYYSWARREAVLFRVFL